MSRTPPLSPSDLILNASQSGDAEDIVPVGTVSARRMLFMAEAGPSASPTSSFSSRHSLTQALSSSSLSPPLLSPPSPTPNESPQAAFSLAPPASPTSLLGHRQEPKKKQGVEEEKEAESLGLSIHKKFNKRISQFVLGKSAEALSSSKSSDSDSLRLSLEGGPSYSDPSPSNASEVSTSSALASFDALKERAPQKAKMTIIVDDRFCCEDTPDNLILDDDDVSGQLIRAATVEKLIQRVTFEGHPDPRLLEDFLLTYRSFITPKRLMELLRERYHTKCPPGLAAQEKEEFAEKFLKPVRLRIFNLCKSWVNKYNADFTDDPKLTKEFEKWMEVLFAREFDSNTRKLIKELHQIRDGKGDEKKKHSREQTKPRPLLLPPVSGAPCLLNFHPLEIARQLTLLEMEQYTQIKPWELLGQGWTKGELGASPHVREMIAWSTRVSQLISTEVIKVPIHTKSQMIGHCIQIAAESMRMHNYNTVMEVLAGFSNSAVNRLQPFFKEVPKKEKKLLKEIKGVMASDKNFHSLRDRIKTSEPPILPYLGTFLTDLTFIEDGNPDRVKNDLINFKKCRLQSQVIRDIQQYQQIPYNLESVPEIQKYLQTAMLMDNKVMYKVSLKHLPRDAKEVSVRELQKIRKAESKVGVAPGNEVKSCKNTMTIDEVYTQLENPEKVEELTLVSLCHQEVSSSEMGELSDMLALCPSVHTLRLCHCAFAERHNPMAWEWMKKLKHIKVLDLSNQDLTFVPEAISGMEKLTTLLVHGNAIEFLPPSIGKLGYLEELKCERNSLREIPASLGSCKKLRSINVNANKLAALPDFLPYMPELRYFYCAENPIVYPVIPPELLLQGGSELLLCMKRVGQQPGKPMGLGFD